MEKISTTELDKILKNSTVEDYEKFAETHYVETYTDLADYLNQYIAIHDLRIPQIIKASHLSKNYAYAIFNGHKKNPSRDRIIALCIAMGMTFEEVQRALNISGTGTLYSKDGRDALITICLHQGIHDLSQYDEVLLSHGYEVIKASNDV